LLNGGIGALGVCWVHWVTPFFDSCCIQSNEFLCKPFRGSRLCVLNHHDNICLMQTLYIKMTMLTCWQEELILGEGSACNYFHPTWKPTSQMMDENASCTTPYVFIRCNEHITKGGHPLQMSTLRPRFFIQFMNYVKKS
jgi:hypothetical protein